MKRPFTLWLAGLAAVAVLCLLLSGCDAAHKSTPEPQTQPHVHFCCAKRPQAASYRRRHTLTLINLSASAPTVGELFTTSNGTWSGNPTAFTYQWQRCNPACANINSAVTSTYTVAQADQGATIDVVVTATNASGSRSQTSAVTGTVLSLGPPPPTNSALPQLSGTTTQGQTLTTSTGTWTNSPASYAYQWQRCDSAGLNCVTTATSTSTYVLGAGDVGDTIRSLVTATNTGGSASATSTASALVVGTASSTFGKTAIGATPNGGMGPDLKRVIQATPTLTSQVIKLSMYLSPTGTVGTENFRGVIYADSAGAPGALLGVSSEVKFTNTSTAGWADLVFPDSVAVTSGTAYWIGVITGGTGSVAQYNFDTVASARDYNSDPYANGPTDPFGTPSSDSEQFSIYATETAAGAPVKTVAPALTDTTSAGRYQQGDVISVSNGTWTNTPTGFTYQWQDCDSGGINCQAIVGATASTYALAASDIGDKIRATVTASNASGAAASSTAASIAVASNGGSTFAPTYVQSANCLSARATPPALTGVTGLSCPLANNVTQGNLIVVAFGYRHASQTATVTDTLASTFHKVAAQTSTQTAGCGSPCSYPFTGEIWWARAPSSGADTITLGLPSAAGVIEQYVHEYNAANPQFDVASTSTGTGATITSAAAATSFAHETLFGYMISNSSVGVAGTGFTQREANDGDITEDRAVSATGSYAATATNPAADGYAGLEASFYGSGTNAAVTPGQPTSVTATGANASAAVNWTAAATGGAPTTYVITPYISGVAQATTTIPAPALSANITGLSNGTAYTFTVTGSNSAGSGPASAASSPVTPSGGAFTVSCALTPAAGNDNASIEPNDGSSGQTGFDGQSNCWGQQTGVFAGTGCSESAIVAGTGCGTGFTHLSGVITPAANATYNKVYLAGCFKVVNNGVQITNSLIVYNGSSCSVQGEHNAGVNNGNASGATGLVMTNDTVDGADGSSSSTSFALNLINATLLRVNAFGGTKQLNYGGAGNTTVTDSYFHAPSSDSGGEHEDVVFANGGFSCCTAQVTFEHDYMEGTANSNSFMEAAFVVLDGDAGSAHDNHITLDSSFASGLYHGDSDWGGCGPSFGADNMKSTNNVFADINGVYLGRAWDPSGTNNVWSGNETINASGTITDNNTPAPGC